MNTLSDITLDTSTLNSVTITGGTISNSDIFQPGITDFSNISTIMINKATTISISDEFYTGEDLLELFKLKAILKEIHPEIFLVQ